MNEQLLRGSPHCISEMEAAIYVIAGATSNLFQTAVLPYLKCIGGFSVYATHHGKTPDCVTDVTYIDHNKALAMATREEFQCALWMSPHDDPALLQAYAKHVPTLTVSSMSIAKRVKAGPEMDPELTPYQLGKWLMFQVPGVYTIAPGFYIGAGHPGATEVLSAGLHGDTTRELHRPLGAPFVNPAFTCNKAPMSVTPKIALAYAIVQWIVSPPNHKTIIPNTFTVLCSNGEYTRDRLRLMALGDPVSEPEDLYSGFPHPVDATTWLPIVVTHASVAELIRAK